MFLDIMAGCLALDIVGQREDKLVNLPGLRALDQSANVEVVGPDAIQRREFSVKDMVGTPPRAAPLKGHEVRHALDHAYLPVLPLVVPAHGAQFRLANVAAASAPAH